MKLNDITVKVSELGLRSRYDAEACRIIEDVRVTLDLVGDAPLGVQNFAGTVVIPAGLPNPFALGQEFTVAILPREDTSMARRFLAFPGSPNPGEMTHVAPPADVQDDTLVEAVR